MPNNCAECGIPCKCMGDIVPYRYHEKRHEACPLIEVPNHGRLVDANALTAAIQDEIDGWRAAGCDVSCYEAILDNYILEAPTIIPASKEAEA